MRQFEVPIFYRSSVISRVKEARRNLDPRKKDLSPSTLDFGPVRFKLARHFGFCYGVEQAIEIAYRAIEQKGDRRLFLLSEMIHNAHVNDDLRSRGVLFLRTTSGETLIHLDELVPDDIVIIPAFGASLEVEQSLRERGIDTQTYDTTCPFVERVWKKSSQIGKADYSIVIHGKRYHEETRATMSHAQQNAPVVVVRDLEEAKDLARVICGEWSRETFYEHFVDRYSTGFDPDVDLVRIGVVNQTTMLATETQAIADLLKRAMIDRYGETNLADHFADTSDTLCYATVENQSATSALIDDGGDVALIVGGFNSSNTSHLVELCEVSLPTYFIRGAADLKSKEVVHYFDIHTKEEREKEGWWPDGFPVDIILTAGASCPDALLDEVIQKVTGWFPGQTRSVEEALAPFESLTT